MADALPRPRESGGEVSSPELVEGRDGEGEVPASKAEPEHQSRRKPGVTQRARSLRQGGNKAEALLWLELKAKRLGGYHFVRQYPIGPYFADFLCRSKRLVVEIDGSQHADNPRDRVRDEFMRAQGYSVLRFWNTDVLKHRRAVCETILAALDGRLTGDVAASDLRYVYAPPASGSSTQLIGITHETP